MRLFTTAASSHRFAHPLHRAALGAALLLAAAPVVWPGQGSAALAQTLPPTAFTYQGRFLQDGIPVNGSVFISFRLYADAVGGSPIATLPATAVQVSNGLFSTPIDFGPSAFREGAARYVEAVIGQPPDATVLSPRQAITPAPLALGVVGMPLTIGETYIDQDQSAAMLPAWSVNAAGNYQSFTAGQSGRFVGFSLLLNTFGATRTLSATLRQGVGAGGAQLGSVSIPVTTLSPAQILLDFSSQNIDLVQGQPYTLAFQCNADAYTAPGPIPGSSGFVAAGSITTNFWFRTSMIRPAYPPFAATSQNAARAQTAARADVADAAVTAASVDAAYSLVLNGLELRLRSAGDLSHGLGWHGVNPFRNTGVVVDGPVLYGYAGGALGSSTGDAASGTIALRWNSNSQVGIGGPPSPAGYRLELPNISGAAGQARANAWVTYSSRAFKQNIRTIDDAQGLVEALRGVRFDWKPSPASPNAAHDFGFIAEEVAQVLPELVSLTPDGPAGLDYGRIVPIAIEALKAQSRTIARQQAEIDQLKARLQRIERAMLPGVGEANPDSPPKVHDAPPQP